MPALCSNNFRQKVDDAPDWISEENCRKSGPRAAEKKKGEATASPFSNQLTDD
jgi:hypothetical protein